MELLVLDEPTSGLDPLMEEVFRQVIREEQQRDGRTVLLSSHILAEVEALCDRVTIIRDGRAVETGTLAEMRHLTRTAIQADLAGPGDRPGHAARRARPADPQRHRAVQRGQRRARRGAATARPRSGVRSLTSQPPTLEELFLRHYDRTQTDDKQRTGVTR